MTLNKGTALIVGFEIVERFGFYSALSLLALFLTASFANGGLAWSEPQAIGLVGTYLGLMYTVPIFGGMIADRVLGHIPAILIGGLFTATGHGLLALTAVFASRDAMIGHPFVFWTAVVLLVSGNSLMKATLVVVLGDSFELETNRDGAYGYYWMAINFGSFLAGVVAGYVAVTFGWPTAFGISGAAMLFAVFCFAVFHNRYLRLANANRSEKISSKNDGEKTVFARVGFMTLFALFLCIFHIGVGQVFGTWPILIERNVDRHVASFVIPTQWVSSLLSLGLIVSTPVQVYIWHRLAIRGFRANLLTRYSVSLALGSTALATFGLATATGHHASLFWPIIAILMMAFGEAVAWTVTYGAIYELSPPSMTVAAVGAYYAATIGLGSYLSGQFGRLAPAMGYTKFFVVLSAVTAFFGLLALAIDPLLRRHGKRARIVLP